MVAVRAWLSQKAMKAPKSSRAIPWPHHSRPWAGCSFAVWFVSFCEKKQQINGRKKVPGDTVKCFLLRAVSRRGAPSEGSPRREPWAASGRYHQSRRGERSFWTIHFGPRGNSLARCVCRPCRGLVRFVRLTHGCRRGLTSGAAPQLPGDLFISPSVAKNPGAIHN